MEKKIRRQFSPEEKIRILRLHLLEGTAVPEICQREGIHPILFYQWQRTFFENGAAALRSPEPRQKAVLPSARSNHSKRGYLLLSLLGPRRLLPSHSFLGHSPRHEGS